MPRLQFGADARSCGIVVAMVAALLAAGPAHTQNQDNPYGGGTRIKPRAAQINQSGGDAARVVLTQFGQCVYSRRGSSAERIMAMPVDAPGYEKEQRALFDQLGDSCLEGDGTLYFSDGLMRAALFEAAYRKKFGSRPAPTAFNAAVNTDPAAVYAQPLSAIARRQLVLQSFADCVVRADPTTVHNLILSPPGSPREETGMTQISTKLGPCLVTGQKIEFSKPSLRGFLAEALYRLAIASENAASVASKAN
jgi:hypothetical protein